MQLMMISAGLELFYFFDQVLGSIQLNYLIEVEAYYINRVHFKN